MTIRSNLDLANKLKGQRDARFLLCDFHVHSPASHDVVSNPCITEVEKEKLSALLGKSVSDWVKHQEEVIAAFPPSEYLDQLIQQRDSVLAKLGIGEYNKWAVVAITDHNVCGYATDLARIAWADRKKNQLFILPGIELDVEFATLANDKTAIHILCIFSPSVTASDIRKAVCDASSANWKEGDKSLIVSSLEEFVNKLRNHTDYPAMVIAAHVASGKGVQKETKKRLLNAKEAEIAHVEAEISDTTNASDRRQLEQQLEQLKLDNGDIDIGVLKKIGRCGFDALQVSSKADEKHYRRLHRYREKHGRAIPLISSDAHSTDKIFHVSEGIYPQLKLSNKFTTLDENQFLFEVRDHAIRYGETRFNYTYAGEVTHWIEGIEVIKDSESAANFWPEVDGLVLPFSRNLNCLIGGRGSGKSAIIEALAFLLKPAEAQEQGRISESKWAEWYGRARSTLSGCQLRLCWKTIGGGVTTESKKGVFLSRYFDSNNRHADPAFTDIDGNTLTSHPLPLVQIYRFHDIEKAAETEGLRNLIDEVSGGLEPIEARIHSIRAELAKQSNALIAEATAINELTKEGAPLRCYAKRKAEYARVNKKEVEAHFKKLDSIEAAGKLLKQLRDQWDEITKNYSEVDIVEFENLTANISAAITSEHKEYLLDLAKLINITDAPLSKFIAALRDLANWQKKTGEKFDSQRQSIKDIYLTLRDKLEQQGLPKGSKDRDAKKKELDASIDTLNTYRESIKQFKKLLCERKDLFEQLKNACRERTELRVLTAEQITNQLRQDLDETILKIEASAQPAADKQAFEKWLEKFLPSIFTRYRTQRIASLLEGGLTPENLRDILLGKRDDADAILVRNHGKATDGNISPEDAKAIQNLAAISRYDPEVSPDIDPMIDEELPQEIKEGVQHFPGDNGTLRLKAVLELDEIIFNDIPVVRLNDRPKEVGSALRPLEELSPGQRCSAVLPILLLNGRLPLIIDQPEDNLDNRLIRQVIVNVLGSIKLRRQVIVATHNPNIPVLGDAERTIVLAAIDEKQSEVRGYGNLDESPIVSAITEIMEGGREAFQYRQSIYQAHWEGVVAQE